MKAHNNILKKLGIALLLLIGPYAVAQTTDSFTIPLSNPGQDGKLIVALIDGSIDVKGYNGSEVIVEATGRQKVGGTKTKNGMKKIADNSLSFTIEEVENKVYVKCHPGKAVTDFTIKVPRKFSVDLRTINKGNITVEGVEGAHEVSNTNGKVTMKDVGGSVIADALNKNITITFTSIDSGANMMFSSLNGHVDVSFPKSLKANILASTDNGDVYTDFEITRTSNSNKVQTSKKDGVYKVKRDKGISGTINGGGPEIVFKSLNGDILIRENN